MNSAMMLTILPLASLTGYLAEEGIPVAPDMEYDAALALCDKISGASSSQAKFSAFMINATKGTVTSDQLTAVLTKAFPDKKVSARTGPHFASQSRTGKLKGCRYEMALAGRTSAKTKDQLTRANELIAAVRIATSMKAIRALINEYDNPTSETTPVAGDASSVPPTE